MVRQKASVAGLSLGLFLAACSGPGATNSATPAVPATSTVAASAYAVSESPRGSRSSASPSEGPKAIRLDVIAPISGLNAGSGADERNGIQLAIDEINQAGGIDGQKLEMRLSDAGDSNTSALDATMKAVSSKPAAIFAPPVTSQDLAIASTILQSGIPTFFVSTADILTSSGAPMYRLITRDAANLSAATTFVRDDLKKTKIAVLHIDDEYGNGAARLVDEYAKKSGLTVVSDQGFLASNRDYSAQLKKIKSSGAEAIVLYGPPSESAYILKQRQVLGLAGIPTLDVNATMHPSLASLVTEQELDGIYAVGTIDPAMNGSEPTQAWLARYRTKFNTPGNTYSAGYYDAVQLLRHALLTSKGITDPEVLRRSLTSIKNYQGISGPLTCTETGDCAHTSWIFQERGRTPAIIRSVLEPALS